MSTGGMRDFRVVGCMIVALGLLALSALAAGDADAAWLEARAVSHEGIQAVDPQVAVDGNGDVIAAWVSGTSSQDIVVAEHSAGTEWTNPVVRISEAEPAKACQDPRLAVDSAGAAILVADCGAGTTPMRFATRTVNGSWSGTSAEIPGTGSGSEPRLGIDDNGDAILVWAGAGATVQSAYRPGGGAWSGVTQASTVGKQAFQPNVAMTHDGYAFALWRQKREESGGDPVVNVLVSRRHGGGAWEATQQLTPNLGGGSTTPVASGEPQIAVNAAGQKLAAWTIENPTVKVFTETHASASALSSWEVGKNISESAAHVEVPRIAIDGGGLGIATVRTYDESGFFRVKATAEATLGGAWPSPVTLGGPVSLSVATEPAVAADPAGDGTVVWRAGSEVEAASRPPGGAFGAATTISNSSHNPFGEPLVTMASSGDTIVTWTTNTSPSHIALAVNDVTPPQISTIVSPSETTVGSSVAMSTSATDAWSTVSVAWDFGDGATATGPSVSHSYATAGKRTITVTATDAVGNSKSETREIQVNPPGSGGEGAKPPGGGDGDRKKLALTATVVKQPWRKILKTKAITLRCGLDATGTCTVKASVSVAVARRIGLKAGKRAKTIAVGSGSAQVAGGEVTVLKVKLTGKVRAAIDAATKPVPIAFEVTGSASGHEPATLSAKLKIKRP